MKTTTIHRSSDFVSREIRIGEAAPSRSSAGHPGTRRVIQDHAVLGQSRISPERAEAARIFGEAKQRADQRAAAETTAEAMRSAREEIRRTQYVTVEQREDVMRIMLARGLGVAEAYEAYVEEGEASPRHGGKLSSVAR